MLCVQIIRQNVMEVHCGSSSSEPLYIVFKVLSVLRPMKEIGSTATMTYTRRDRFTWHSHPRPSHSQHFRTVSQSAGEAGLGLSGGGGVGALDPLGQLALLQAVRTCAPGLSLVFLESCRQRYGDFLQRQGIFTWYRE